MIFLVEKLVYSIFQDWIYSVLKIETEILSVSKWTAQFFKRIGNDI